MRRVNDDAYWMRQALQRAQQAVKLDEAPVGALLVYQGQVIAEGWNQMITLCDPTAHAEILTLRQAASKLGNYRLLNTTLYVTLEPCIMCLGAMLHARIHRLVYGAKNQKTGAVVSGFHLLDVKHSHRIEWEGGCLAVECAQLLQTFFQKKRHSL